MIHPIVKYGDPVLETPAKHVEKFDEGLQKLVADMFESMYAANGVGLAAPQIGVSLRLSVIDVSNGKNPEAKIVCIISPENAPSLALAKKCSFAQSRATTYKGKATVVFQREASSREGESESQN